MTNVNVELPEPKENWDGTLTSWDVPLFDSLTGGFRRYPGSVFMRASDHRISVECPSILECAADARALAAALLACATAMDDGVRPSTVEERVAKLRGAITE